MFELINLNLKSDAADLKRNSERIANEATRMFAKSTDKLVEFMRPAAPYMGAIFIVLGLFLTFWGNTSVNIVIFTVVTVALSVVGLELCFKITSNST